MAFLDDVAADRATVFLSPIEFGETVTYRVASTGATASVVAQVEDQNDSVLSDGAVFRVSEADVAVPVKGDQITWAGAIYTVLFTTLDMGIWQLDSEREEEIT